VLEPSARIVTRIVWFTFITLIAALAMKLEDRCELCGSCICSRCFYNQHGIPSYEHFDYYDEYWCVKCTLQTFHPKRYVKRSPYLAKIMHVPFEEFGEKELEFIYKSGFLFSLDEQTMLVYAYRRKSLFFDFREKLVKKFTQN